VAGGAELRILEPSARGCELVRCGGVLPLADGAGAEAGDLLPEALRGRGLGVADHAADGVAVGEGGGGTRRARVPVGEEYVGGYANIDETYDQRGPHSLGKAARWACTRRGRRRTACWI